MCIRDRKPAVYGRKRKRSLRSTGEADFHAGGTDAVEACECDFGDTGEPLDISGCVACMDAWKLLMDGDPVTSHVRDPKYRWYIDNNPDPAYPSGTVRLPTNLAERFGQSVIGLDSNDRDSRYRLMVLREPSYEGNFERYGMTNGIQMGWVNREQAIKILAEKGIYPLEEELDKFWPPLEEPTKRGLKSAQKRFEDREKLRGALGVVRDAEQSKLDTGWDKIESVADVDKFSWTVLDSENMLETGEGLELYTLYDQINAIGHGRLGGQLEGDELYLAYQSQLQEPISQLL